MPTFTPLDTREIANQTLRNAKIRGKAPWRPNKGDPVKKLPLGENSWWGVPFLVGHGKKVAILPKQGAHTAALDVNEKARWVIIAHCSDLSHTQRSQYYGVVEPGQVLAEYAMHYADGTCVTVSVRRRFEISDYWFGWGQVPFGCWCHREHLPEHGCVPDWGMRQTHVKEGTYGLEAYWWLFPWENPHPEKKIVQLEFSATGRATLAIGGVTLGSDAAHPICRTPRQTVRVSVRGGVDEVDTSVDRGVVLRNTQTTPPPKEFTTSKVRGWGRDPDTPKPKGKRIVEAVAHPDAQLLVSSGDVQGQVRWGDAIEKRVTTAGGRIQVGPSHTETQRVHIELVDTETGRATPARIHLCTPDGDYIPPVGHNRFVNEAWFEDVGSDLALGGMTYAYTDGTCQADLPVGEVLVEVVKGFEYTPVRKRLTIRPGTRNLRIPISRWTDQRSRGWLTGDTHVHFVSTETGRLEAQAEDVNVLNLLAAKWGELYTNVTDLTGGLSGVSNDDVLVFVSTENRQHVMGHISLLGCKSPVFPLSCGGADEAAIGEPMELMLADWAERCREAGGLVILPHFPSPYAEPPIDVILGKVDGAEIRSFSGVSEVSYAHREYYRMLNCGARVAVVGGTDKMSNGMPIGGVRTYAYTGTNGELSYDAWANAIREGRTFTSSGPILDLQVEGRHVGDTLRLPPGGGNVEVIATAASAMPFDRLEIVCGGEVVASVETGRSGQKARIKTSVPIAHSSWIAARCYGRNRVWHCWPMGVEAHTSPVYIPCGREEYHSPKDATYLLSVVEGAEMYINRMASITNERTRKMFMRRIHDARDILLARGGKV